MAAGLGRGRENTDPLDRLTSATPLLYPSSKLRLGKPEFTGHPAPPLHSPRAKASKGSRFRAPPRRYSSPHQSLEGARVQGNCVKQAPQRPQAKHQSLEQ